jgi:glycine cleavage system aminomethyltransferase T
MREHVGVIDLTPFTKHEVSGPARGVARLARREQGADKVGRIALSHALTKRAASVPNSRSPSSRADTTTW